MYGERWTMKIQANRSIMSIALLVGSCFFVSVAGAVEVSATIDRNPIYLDESVNLVLSVEGEEAMGISPDLDPVRKDFEILRQSTQTNINIVNNKPHFVQSWQIEIQPKRLGLLEIPSLMIAGEQTQPIQIEVQEFKGNVATEGAEIFMEVEASSNNPYVQSQVNLTIRLFYSVRIVSGTLSEPNVPFATIKGPAQDNRYNARRSGKDYGVVERRYALFPEQSGALSIPPIEFTAVVERLDPVTNAVNHYRVRYSSESIPLNVRGIPRSFSGTTWLPARDLKLQDSWKGRAPNLEFGKPESRQITIDAVGLRDVQLPQVNFEENDSVKVYIGQNSELKTSQIFEWNRSHRIDEFAIIPQSDSVVEIPKFELVWWDIDEDQEKVAVLPAISVQLGLLAAQPLSSELGNAIKPSDSVRSDENASVWSRDRQWKLISLVLAVVWLMTLVLWYLSRRWRGGHRIEKDLVDTHRIESERKRLRNVRQACSKNDAVAISQALLDWAVIFWVDQPPRNLLELGRRLNSDELATALIEVDRAIYSERSDTVDGQVVWRLLAKAIDSNNRRTIGSKRSIWTRSREKKLEQLWPETDAYLP